jgi:hypothetical protein
MPNVLARRIDEVHMMKGGVVFLHNGWLTHRRAYPPMHVSMFADRKQHPDPHTLGSGEML